MIEPKRALTFRKARFKRRAGTTSKAVSKLFRKVKLGGEVDMDEVYKLAYAIVAHGARLEEIADVAARLKMAPEVLRDLGIEGIKLKTYSEGLKKVAEAYFGIPVQALPMYTPMEIQPTKGKKSPAGTAIASLIDDVEEKA